MTCPYSEIQSGKAWCRINRTPTGLMLRCLAEAPETCEIMALHLAALPIPKPIRQRETIERLAGLDATPNEDPADGQKWRGGR